MSYSKPEIFKLTIFWSIVVGIILFVIDSILGIAKVDQTAIIVIFVLAILATAVGAGLWLYLKIKKTNRKITR